MYNFFIEEDDGTLVYHGKVTKHTFSNGKKNISISGILDSASANSTGSTHSQNATYPFGPAGSGGIIPDPKATPNMRYLDANKGAPDPDHFDLEEPEDKCACPIRDLMASGHLPGCPEKS